MPRRELVEPQPLRVEPDRHDPLLAMRSLLHPDVPLRRGLPNRLLPVPRVDGLLVAVHKHHDTRPLIPSARVPQVTADRGWLLALVALEIELRHEDQVRP